MDGASRATIKKDEEVIMALLIFNFDGTGNEPEDAVQKVKKGRTEDDNITNVLKFHLMCGGNLHAEHRDGDPSLYGESTRSNVNKCFYYQGVGTYGNWWQRLVNQGISPESKNVASILTRAYADFNASYQNGDQLIVTGFSRGAALARRFCAKLVEKSNAVTDSTTPFIYLAAFDTVASIGLPNMSKSERPDFDVVFEKGCTLSSHVKEATHMVSLDDKRKAFQPTLMNHEKKVTEIWFSGAHSDVGGGYYRDGLSDVALTYLIEWVTHQTKNNSLINPELRICTEKEINTALPPKLKGQIGIDDIERKPEPLGKNHQQDRWPVVDWLTLEDRLCCVIEKDSISKDKKPVLHNAVTQRIAFDKDYRPKSLRNTPHQVWFGFTQNNEEGSGVKRYANNPRPEWHSLELGESISTTVFAVELFNHTGILVEAGEAYEFSVAATEEWQDASITCDADGWNVDEESLGWKELPIKLARSFKRVKDCDWFTLCATVGTNDELAKGVGSSGSYQATTSGELTLFANDIESKMGNNVGHIMVTITRKE